MAEILLARAQEPAAPERLVVLKRMHRQLAADREYVKMFLDEAKIATTLRHPNVVEVYESGEDDGQYYIAMEYLHGHDLRRVLSDMARRNIPMQLAHALAIVRAICRGLDYTHERKDATGELLGIVHRDVSPHNVLLTYAGRVKLVDFGIAKTSVQLSRTRTGILKGKVAYMSPEQAMGESLDRRSDVFCIGILLWEMTTGHSLYRRKSELETLKAVVEHDAPLPSLLAPGYPRELEQIVMKTLTRSREQRWATAGELEEALSAFAKRSRLDLRPAAIRSLMASTFSHEVAVWRAAQAEGASLGDHLAATLDRPNNVPMLHDRSPNSVIEELPTRILWPSQPTPTPSSPRWWQWRPPTRWRPQQWQRRSRWVAGGAGVIVIGGVLGWLISALLRGHSAPAPPTAARPPAVPALKAPASAGSVREPPPMPTVAPGTDVRAVPPAAARGATPPATPVQPAAPDHPEPPAAKAPADRER
jgi:serine/threonine protein kinase